MKTFLSKLGNFLATAVSLALGIGPLVNPFLGGKYSSIEATVTNDLTQMAQVVISAEAFLQGPGRGIEKLKATTPLILQILRTSQAFDGKKIANEALAEEGAAKIVSGLADFMNAIHPDEAQKA